ncbi:patatin-like phospholipase family protein [Bacteroidales bacterium OttesenSCG-928-B11]|nr:patatin-like phospholipase family protein [Bacteroidales bacterium OttesenSCG-928-B11]
MAKIRILSIDGGGIKGVIPAIILEYLEKRLQVLSGNPNAVLSDYFDMIAGTSTGGLLTCFYLLPPFPDEVKKNTRYFASEASALYEQYGRDIFKPKVPMGPLSRARALFDEIYSAEGLQNLLAQKLGNVKLSEMRKHCLITAYDITERKSVFFTLPEAQKYPHKDYYIKDVARATSAAPTFFEIAKITSIGGKNSYLIDGGMFANNPAICALVEAQKTEFEKIKNPRIEDIYILSLGTGRAMRGYDYEKAKNWGITSWAIPLLNIFTSGSSEVVDSQLENLYSSRGLETCYHRIDPDLIMGNEDMDDASDHNIKLLKDVAMNYINTHIKMLDRIAEELIKYN